MCISTNKICVLIFYTRKSEVTATAYCLLRFDEPLASLMLEIMSMQSNGFIDIQKN